MSIIDKTSLWALFGAASLVGCSAKTETPYDQQRGADLLAHAGLEGAGGTPVASPATWPSLAPEGGVLVNQGVGSPSTGAGGVINTDAGDGSAGSGGAGTGGNDGSVGTGGNGTGGTDGGGSRDAQGNALDDVYVNMYLQMLSTWSSGTPSYTDSVSAVQYSGAPVTLQPLMSVAYTTVTPVAYATGVGYTLYGYGLKIGNNPVKYYSDYHALSSGTGSFSIRVSSTVCSYLSTSCYVTTMKVSPLTYWTSYGYAAGTTDTTVDLIIDCGGC
jgi:hypothetical protein